MEDLSLAVWEALDRDEQESRARRLVSELPEGFSFRSLETCELGGIGRRVAEFDFEGATFVLVNGGEFGVGYDDARAWEPEPDELASWEETAEEYEVTVSFAEYISRVTLRPRTIALQPLLVESAAAEIGWVALPSDDPEIREIAAEHLSAGSGTTSVQLRRDGAQLRVRRESDGSVRAHRAESLTHAETAALWARHGFRFPTSDEWEYLCGAGASTLFRWGDHVPCDRYPTDVSPEEIAWRQAWVQSHGTLERPPEGFVSDWDFHREPNALGLCIASDPYKNELVAEPDMTRGGDGGNMVCGGVGYFLGWLTLATAYFEEHTCRRDPEEPVQPGYTIGRRVLALSA